MLRGLLRGPFGLDGSWGRIRCGVRVILWGPTQSKRELEAGVGWSFVGATWSKREFSWELGGLLWVARRELVGFGRGRSGF